MENFNKKLILILILLVLATGLGLIVYTGQKAAAYKKILSDKEALLIIDYGQGKERWFKGEVREGMTVRDVLQTSSLVGNFSFAANANLAMLDGLASNQEKQWKCYLNNQEIQEELDAKKISPKDKISCRYK